MTDQLPRGVVPPGNYAKGARSPVVYVLLCPACAGYAPTLPEDFPAEAHCQGCGAYVREVHRFQALIMSAANGGCMCDSGNRMDQVTGDLPTEESALAVWTEVKTRPALAAKAETVSPICPNCGNASPEHERGVPYCDCGACGYTWDVSGDAGT